MNCPGATSIRSPGGAKTISMVPSATGCADLDNVGARAKSPVAADRPPHQQQDRHRNQQLDGFVNTEEDQVSHSKQAPMPRAMCSQRLVGYGRRRSNVAASPAINNNSESQHVHAREALHSLLGRGALRVCLLDHADDAGKGGILRSPGRGDRQRAVAVDGSSKDF